MSRPELVIFVLVILIALISGLLGYWAGAHP